MSYNAPYAFKVSGKQIVIQHSHGATLCVKPQELGQASGRGGQGGFAHWKVHLIGSNHCRMQSVKTGKYLRIWRGGAHIDVQGGTGQFTKFKVHRIANNGVKLESAVFGGKYVAVKPGKNVAIGNGGPHTALYPKRQGGGGGGGGGVVVAKPSAQGAWGLPYHFKATNTVVIKSAHGRHLRVSPNNAGAADGTGGTGGYARWKIIKDGQNFVKLQNTHTSKYLRLVQNGAVNVGGGGGVWTRFRVHLTRAPNFAKLESAKVPGKYIAIGPNGVVRQGGGGIHCHLSFWRQGAAPMVQQQQQQQQQPRVVVVNPAQSAVNQQQMAHQQQMAAQQAQMQQQMAQMRMHNEAQMAQQRGQLEQQRQQMEAQQQASAAQVMAQQQAVLDQQQMMLEQQQQQMSRTSSSNSNPPLQAEGSMSGSAPVNPYYGQGQQGQANISAQPVYPVLQPQEVIPPPQVDVDEEEKAAVSPVSAMGQAGEVLAWLTGIDMQAYFSTFQANGFDSLSSIAEMTQSDLEQMKSPMEVKLGHRKLLLAAAVTAQFAGRMVKVQSARHNTWLHEYGKPDREKGKVTCTLQHNDKKDVNGAWWLFETLSDNRCRLQHLETGAYLRLSKDDEEAKAVAPYGTRQELVLEKAENQKGVYFVREQLGDLFLKFNEASTFGYNKVEASERRTIECGVRLMVLPSKVTRIAQGMRFDPNVRCVVALQSVAFGTFVCAEKNDSLVCNRPRAGKQEQFVCVPMGDGKVGLQGERFKKYVTVEKQGKVAADKKHAKGYEQFEAVMADDGSFALRSHRGTYLMALPDGRMTATKADTGKASPWERFMVSVIRLDSQ